MIVIAIVAGVVLCVFTVCFFHYKENELEFKKMERESAEKAIKERNSLDIEKEYTEQSRINLQKEIEKTKQLQIESDNARRKQAENYIKFLNS